MINNKKVVATIQARMTSTRLPGKVLKPLAGRPVLAHMIERHRRSAYTDEVVVATTTNKEDDPVAALCEAMGCAYFRGSEKDVLGRVLGAAAQGHADIVVQGMADSPLVDWRFVDTILSKLVEGDCDFASNELKETFPVGFDVRAFTYAALLKSDALTQDPVYREHASYYIFKHPDIFKHVNWEAEGDMAWPALRLTLDTPEDYALISAVYDALYPANPDFSAEDVVHLLKGRPDLVRMNSTIKQFIPSV